MGEKKRSIVPFQPSLPHDVLGVGGILVEPLYLLLI